MTLTNKELDMDQGNKLPAASAESSGTFVGAVDKVSAGVHERVDQAANTARPVVDRLAAGAHRSVDNVAAVASRAAEAIEEGGGQVKEAHEQLTAQCRSYIQENPLTSLGLAVAAGFVLSRLVGSRSDA